MYIGDDVCCRGDLNGKRVVFDSPPSAAYVVTQWAIWRAGGVAVPLCITHPPAEKQYYVSQLALYNCLSLSLALTLLTFLSSVD